MIENKWTKEKQQEWIKQYSMTPEQSRKKIDQKLERIVKLAQAQRKVNERLGLH